MCKRPHRGPITQASQLAKLRLLERCSRVLASRRRELIQLRGSHPGAWNAQNSPLGPRMLARRLGERVFALSNTSDLAEASRICKIAPRSACKSWSQRARAKLPEQASSEQTKRQASRQAHAKLATGSGPPPYLLRAGWLAGWLQPLAWSLAALECTSKWRNARGAQSSGGRAPGEQVAAAGRSAKRTRGERTARPDD